MDKNWNKFIGKNVRLIVEDTPHPKHKDGVFTSIDETHIFLEITKPDLVAGKMVIELVPFSRVSVKRVEVKNE